MSQAPITPTPPKLTDAQKRALAASSHGGPIYCAPAASGVTPRARWNVCQKLVELELLHPHGPPTGKVWRFMLTDAGMARARAIVKEAQA